MMHALLLEDQKMELVTQREYKNECFQFQFHFYFLFLHKLEIGELKKCMFFFSNYYNAGVNLTTWSTCQ